MLLRRAKDEDSLRLAALEREDSPGAACGAEEAPQGSLFAAARSARLTVRGGRTDVLPGRGRASGGMAVSRSARSAGLRRQALALYAAGYLLLFGLYAYFLLTGTTTITPASFVERSFPKRAGASIADLEQAALGAMRGSRTPAEVRVAQSLNFYDGNGEPAHAESGERLTLRAAASLARTIITDWEKPEPLRSFTEPIAVYRETYLAGVNWPVCLSLYNAFGFFLMLALFLWRPLMQYLGTQGKKTAVALRNSRDALEAAEEYGRKRRELPEEAANRAAALRAAEEKRLEQERAAALEAARRRAEEISGGVRTALADAERELAARLGAEAARSACDRALDILRERIGRSEHDRAVDELVADIGGMRFPGGA